MKPICILLAIALLGGCATTASVSKLEGQGMKRTFPATYAATWQAALNAARLGQLQVVGVDEPRGTITAKSQVRGDSWGEHVSIWVRKVDAANTEVEVASRMAGTYLFFKYDWELPVLNNIALDLHQPVQTPPPAAPSRSPKSKA